MSPLPMWATSCASTPSISSGRMDRSRPEETATRLRLLLGPVAKALLRKYRNLPMPNQGLTSDQVAAVVAYSVLYWVPGSPLPTVMPWGVITQGVIFGTSYALAAMGANDGLWDWDLRANEIYYSRRWKEMLGYAETDIGSAPDEWFTRIHRTDVERVRAALSAHLDGLAGHFESEHRMRCKDGSFRWMLSRGVAVVPSPSCPKSFLPQHLTAPRPVTTTSGRRVVTTAMVANPAAEKSDGLLGRLRWGRRTDGF